MLTAVPLGPVVVLSEIAAAAAGAGVVAATFTVNTRFAANVKVGAPVAGEFCPPTTATTVIV
jgi:hypothetical protein